MYCNLKNPSKHPSPLNLSDCSSMASSQRGAKLPRGNGGVAAASGHSEDQLLLQVALSRLSNRIFKSQPALKTPGLLLCCPALFQELLHRISAWQKVWFCSSCFAQPQTWKGWDVRGEALLASHCWLSSCPSPRPRSAQFWSPRRG